MTGKTLDLGGVKLPLDFVTRSSAVLGMRGSGKTTAGIVLFEEIHAVGVPVVSIDPKGDHWGIRAGREGKPDGGLPVAVLGGLHGDIPLEADAGKYIADLVREKNISAVLDVSEFSASERRRFLAAFVDKLYRRPEREPMHLILEEAHEVVPQRVDAGDAAMVGAFERLVKMGRYKGIGVTMLTQRSASLNKNVLTQVDNLFMMRTVSPQDRAAVKAWIDTHSAFSTIIDSLPSLETGECWLWQPEHGEPVHFRFRQRRTYDAGTTPKVGEKRRPQAVLTGVDLAEIQTAMAATIERAASNDPTKLKAEVARLKREVDRAKAAAMLAVVDPQPVEVRVEVPIIPVGSDRIREALRHVSEAQRALEAARLGVQTLLDEAGAAITGIIADIERAEKGGGVAAAAPNLEHRPVQTPAPEHYVPPAVPRTARPAAPAASPAAPGEIKLRAGAVRMVESLGRMQPLRLTKSQWGMVSGLKTSGGTWSTYLGELRRLGFIDEGPAGFTLTDAGFDFLGGRPAPMTAVELQEHYRRILRAGAVRMLDEVMRVYPHTIERAELGEAAGISTAGGTFSTYLGELVRNGLIERDGQSYRATDILMRGAEA